MDRNNPAWNVPRSNSVRFEHCSSSDVAELPPRMASLVCNRPSIAGYSMLWSGGLVQLHAHRRDESKVMYKYSSHKSWLHMPIDAGEVITEIWLRRSLIRRERAVGVSLSTPLKERALINDRSDQNEHRESLRCRYIFCSMFKLVLS
jgi:hypothetical protein